MALHRLRRVSATRPPRRFFSRPRGFVDTPAPGSRIPRGPLHVLGWCLFDGSSVARVEVSVNGGAPERARIALERPEIPALTPHRDAPIAGWEHKVDLAELPAGTLTVRIEAIAHALDGRRLALAPVEYELAAPDRGLPAGGERLAELRERSVRRAGPRRGGARPGIRVLAFAHSLGYDGGSLYLFELLRRLDRDPGLSFEVVTMRDGPLREALEELGIPVHLTDEFPVTSPVRYEGHLAELVALSAAGDFDVALVNSLRSFAGADLATRLGIPLVWAVHESFPLPMFWFTAYAPGALHPYVRAQAEGALRSADAVVFPARATSDLFLPHAHPDRLIALPYGIELEPIDDARGLRERRAGTRRQLGIPDDARVVLCMGTVEPRKSQAMLAAAFAEVADRHPRARLVIVGETGDAYCAGYRAALHAFVARAGLADRARVEPVTADPYPWHAAADVLVCASDIESLPRVVAEAMAFGTPVLSTRVFGVPELVEDGRTGYLCDARDAGELARGLERVLNARPDELRAVADRASEHVRARHDPGVAAARMLELLHAAVAGAAVRRGERAARAVAHPGPAADTIARQ